MKNKNRRIVSFLLALCLVITSCSRKKNDSNIDMLSYVDGPDTRSTSLISLIKDNLDSIDETGLDDIFNIDDDISLVLDKKTSDCDYVYYGNISSLLYKIIDNSKEYASLNSEYLSLFDDRLYNESYTNYFGVDFNQEQLAIIKERILVTLESYLSYVYGAGSEEDIHNLIDLKIVVFGDKTNEKEEIYGDYDSSYNLVRINFYTILDTAWELDDIIGRFDEVIKHELNHALAHSCDDKIDKGSIDEIDFLNGWQYSFLTEASAESSLYNLGIASGYEAKGNVFTYTYSDFRDLESKLLLCSLFDNKTTVEEYYRSINNEDINSLLSILGAKTLEEKKELFRAVYAMDALVGRNNYSYQVLGSKDEYTTEDNFKLNDKIKYKHYISILKYSIRSLIDYNVNETLLSLDDNLLLYYIVLSNIIDDSFFLDNSGEYNTYYYYEDFISEYQLIEDNYFNILSKFYSKDVSEIKEIFDSYKDIDINKSLSYLSTGNALIDSNSSLNERLNTLLDRFPKLKVVANLQYYNGYTPSRNYIKMLEKVMSKNNKDKTLKLRK